MATFIFTVEVSGDDLTIEQAEQIASERIGYDEDLSHVGIHDYSIDRTEVKMYERGMVPDSQLATDNTLAHDIGNAPSQFPAHVIRALATDYTLLKNRLSDRIVPRETFQKEVGS